MLCAIIQIFDSVERISVCFPCLISVDNTNVFLYLREAMKRDMRWRVSPRTMPNASPSWPDIFVSRLAPGILSQELVTHEGPVEQLLRGDINPFRRY